MTEQINQASEAVETRTPEERFEEILGAEDSTEQPEQTEEQSNELGETNEGFIELETLKNRKITFKEQQDQGEEIILQVPRLASEHQKH